ncbi:MAG TPA: hypothetical protein VH255_00510 [Verrucomicrobiae bacterium]|nr:hypothetical protein [Verrucomicrobiae bacterium]
MIALDSDFLLFKMANGESVPFSSEMISVEVTGETGMFDQEFVKQATASVFHYFKVELGRETVSVGEFAGALEKVLRGFAASAGAIEPKPLPEISEFDLRLIAGETSSAGDLFFFPRLRDELRSKLAQSPRLLRFRGLRGCVKKLAGARRWSPSCQRLHDRIVDFLRGCLSAETKQNSCTLLVE